MTDLKQLYRQAVVGRVAELEAALRSPDGVAHETIRRVAHSLRGSGGTYGFPDVSVAAGAVEDASAGQLEANTRELLNVLRLVIDGGPRASNLLMVDDDPEILLLLRTVLAGPGRELATAETGAEAAVLLAGRHFSLIIVDLLLPDVDGRDVLRRIRADPQYATTPVIVLSAKTTKDARQECIALGATAFFEKPFDPEAVAAAVGAQLIRAGDTEPDASA